MTLSLPRDWWGYHWSPPHPRSIAELIAAGTLDAELAATLWLLVEARVPVVVVAGPPLAGKSTLLTALLDFLPATARAHVLRGRSETFEWLPEAESLGWVRPSRPDNGVRTGNLAGIPRLPATSASPAPASPTASFLLASELSNHLPTYTWGERARVAIRATSLGYGLGTTAHADSLAELLAQLQEPPVGLTPDELRSLGVVLVVRMLHPDGSPLNPLDGSRDIEIAPLNPAVRRRVVAAHYIRPLERDAGGHVQRRPPAVLATWNEATDTLDHFEWGVAPELAARACRTAAEFEREQSARARFLARLAADAPQHTDVAAAIAAYHAARAGSPASGTPLQAHLPVQPDLLPGSALTHDPS